MVRSLVRRMLLTVVLSYLVVCLLLYLLQDRLIFFPGEAPTATPRSIGLEFEEVHLGTEDGLELHGWWIPARDGGRGAVLVAHGNAGNIGHRLGLARAFHGMGLAVLLFDYRGYGNSEGAPSEEGLYLDAEAAHDHLLHERQLAKEEIVVYGESLGGGVAVELALRRGCAGLITESAFTSLPDVAAGHYKGLPVRWLARYRFDNASKLPRIGRPYLALHSPDDEIVPFEHAERLFAAAREPKRLARTEGGHNDGGFLARSASVERVRSFVDEVLGD